MSVLVPRAPVHLLWDWATLPCPSDVALGDALARLHELASLHGRWATATILAPGGVHAGSMDPSALQHLREQGVEVEEVRGEEHAGAGSGSEMLLTRLLRLTLQLQQQAAIPSSSSSSPRAPRPSVVVLSSLQSLSPSLALMRQSGLFGSIVLLHGESVARELPASASSATSFDLFLRGESPMPVGTGTAYASTTDSSATSSTAPSPANAPTTPPTYPSTAGGGGGVDAVGLSGRANAMSSFAHLQLRTSPTVEDALNVPLAPLTLSAHNSTSLLGAYLPAAGSATNAGATGGSNVLSLSPHSSQPLLPTPSPHNLSVSGSSNMASTPSMRGFLHGSSHSAVSSPLHSSTAASAAAAAGAGGPAGGPITPGSKGFGFNVLVGGLGSARGAGMKMAASAPSSPTGYHSTTHQAQQHRSFFPASSTLSPSQQQLIAAAQQQQQHSSSSTSSPSAAFFRSVSRGGGGGDSGAGGAASGERSIGGGGAGGHHGPGSSSRVRACVLAYQRIIAYCEGEKLIPRESVLKKRLVDSRADMGAAASAGVGSDFEEFLFVVTQVAGVGVLEGEPPQRIVWPRGADGGPRRFPCADFFTPQARLTPAQNAALMEFLYRVQPEVERGRFGFATYLARHGPPFIQRLPHGVLVELVQLLLNMKVLLFRKGKVSVASKSEAMEAQNLGLFFTAENFLTPAASRAVSPTPAQQAQQHQQPEQSIWDSPPPATAPSSLPMAGDEASIWSTPAAPTSLHQHAHQGDRPLISQRRSSVGGSPLYAAAPFLPLGGGSASFRSPLGGSSFSVPATRASSPTRSPPGFHAHGNVQGSSRFESRQSPQQHHQLGGAAEVKGMSLPPAAQRKSISSLQPLPVHAAPRSSSIVAAAVGFDASQVPASLRGNDGGAFKPNWLKDDAGLPLTSGAGGSLPASALASRRSSLSDAEAMGSTSWRASPSPAQAQLHASLNPLRFEQSSGFAGEAQDACDPAAVLSAKLAQLNRSTLEALSTASNFDDLSRFTAAVQFRPTFHFEKSGAAHTPEWVAVLTFCVGTHKFQLSSSTHSKKDAAKADVAMRALMAIEDNQLPQAPHVNLLRAGDNAGQGQGQSIPAQDAVVDLARLLNFLQQAPVVYYLSRATQMSTGPGSGRSSGGAGGRLDGRRGSTGTLHQRHHSGGSGSQHLHMGPTLWNATARIQVKSVNVLTGEAQPAVSASTPFSHTVQGATSKQEAKELIAASLLAQIERARVVNAALFTVLAAANSTRLIAALPATASIYNTAESSNGGGGGSAAGTLASHALSDSIWSAPVPLPLSNSASAMAVGSSAAMSSSMSTSSNLHGSHSQARVPSVDMSRIEDPSASSASSHASSSSASLFSLHTPVPGRPFAGISSIGIATPHTATGDNTPLSLASPTRAQVSHQQSQPRPQQSPLRQGDGVPSTSPGSEDAPAETNAALAMGLRPLLRSVSEIEAEETSKGAAESALYETPRHSGR